MNKLDLHILILCVVVFTLLVAIFIILFAKIYKQAVRLINVGADDEKIKLEHDKKEANKKKNKTLNIVSIVVESILAIVLIGIFSFTIYIDVVEDNVVGNLPHIKTVNSSSMSKKYDGNTYLVENDLNDQISMDDLIVLEKLPDVDDIKLYDIVLYENKDDDILILHRIVHIYEVGEIGNDERMFVFQGDNVFTQDARLVSYDDMKGIYKGKHIERVGSFVRFMHSPAGYLCIILAFLVLIATPIIENRVNKVKRDRLREIGYIE